MAGVDPRASCVLIFLDGERFIDEAIRSVVGQQGCDDWELVLVDDGSTDASTAIARRWAATDPDRIRYVEHPGHANRGMSASRNLGIEVARGEWVGFLDCDDVWLPSALAHRLRVAAAHPDADAVIGQTWRWFGWSGDPDDEARDCPLHLPAGIPPLTTVEPPRVFAGIYGVPGHWRVPATCSVLIRRRALIDIGGLASEFTGLYEDQVLYAKIGLHLRTVIDDRALALYRQHPDSACAVAADGGEWSATERNPAEDRFLAWLDGYVRRRFGDDGGEMVVVKRNLDRGAGAADAPAPPATPPSWRTDALGRLPAPVRRAGRRVRRRLGGRAGRPRGGVFARWTAQHVAPFGAARVLLVAGDGDDTPWSSVVPDGALASFERDAVVRRCALGGLVDEEPWADLIVLTVAATRAQPATRWLASALRALAPEGTVVALIAGAAVAGAGQPAAPRVDEIRAAVAVACPTARPSFELFGNARTADAARRGAPAASLPGSVLDDHRGGVEAMVALTVRRPA